MHMCRTATPAHSPALLFLAPLFLALPCLASGCSDDEPPPPKADAGSLTDVADVAEVADVADATGPPVDAGQADAVAPSDAVTGADTADAGVPDAGGDCPGGAGCPCQQPTDCKSTFCIESPAGWICPRMCADGCKADETCLDTTGPEGEAVAVCVPRWGRICNPCSHSLECGAVGIKGAACVDRGDEGAFCGAPCAGAADCPAGFNCQQAADVDGTKSKQCVHATLACVCSQNAINDGLATKCQAPATGSGTCKGNRQCAKAGSPGAPSGGGLTACTPATTAPEDCNGEDDNCDGQTDEATCETNDACAVSACQAVTLATDGWDCVVTSKTNCDDGIACTADTCDPKTGCKHEAMADGAACGNQDICKNDVCIAKDMVEIPAGPFWMGCNAAVVGAAGCGYEIELPQHEVYIDAFLMDIYEVTVARYGKCVKAGACTEPLKDFGYSSFYSWLNPGKEEHPIVGVDWSQAHAYCKWVHPKGRLPTEAEWEKAARGGCDKNKGSDCAKAMRTYPWGNQPPDCDRAVMLIEPPTGCTPEDCGQGCKTLFTFPVGSKPKGISPYGVYDMAGNVSEWVQDCLVPNTYDKNKANGGKNPVWNVCSDTANRHLRGGSFSSLHKELRASDRHDHVPNSVEDYVGFRCARDK